MKKTLISALFVALVSACSTPTNLLQPTEADVQRFSQQGKTTDLATLDQGYHLFQQNCGGCHDLPAPSRRSMDQWNKILPKMFPKTKLTEQEKSLVQNYIEARR